MRFKEFSERQKQALNWWRGPEQDRDAVICDGAVRSGKTFCMGLSFVCWAMTRFRDQRFALCGKTAVALRRNLTAPLLPVLRELGFRCEEKTSRNLLTIRRGRRENTFYLFGGRDEGSAALMPRSFVEQALARCSVEGAKFWFNCNPEGPEHTRTC